MDIKKYDNINLKFSNITIKAIVKIQFEKDDVETSGWVRTDDLTIKPHQIPTIDDIENWREFFIFPVDMIPFEIISAIIEIYENYEGYLLFTEYRTIGNVPNQELEDVYGGEHLI